MKMIDLAIVTPTLNEEPYIGMLLDSLAMQTVQPKEVIIVDAMSKDNTEAEVKKRSPLFSLLQFYVIPKHTISKQRNFGVLKSSAKHILFLDADMVFTKKDNLKNIWKTIQTKHSDVAIWYVMPLSDLMKDKLMYGTWNTLTTVMKPLTPLGTTMNLYVKKSVFEKLGGFDEKVRVGEDFEFLSRVKKAKFSFRVCMRPILYTSARRLEYEGRVNFVKKLLRSIVYVRRYGYSKNPVEYAFGKFSKPSSKKQHIIH